MSEELFPSGPWTGFYNYRPGDRHRMDLRLTFANGILTGDGTDDVGRFFMRGRYDPATRECYWTKTYVGAHDVFYRGFREGKGIWGTWEIGAQDHGGFHIWPKGLEAGESDAESVGKAAPVEVVGEELPAAKDLPVEGKSRRPEAADGSAACRLGLRTSPAQR